MIGIEFRRGKVILSFDLSFLSELLPQVGLGPEVDVYTRHALSFVRLNTDASGP